MTQNLTADVLICGGGISGFAAAVSAARLGAKVILVERLPFVGGAAYANLVNPFMLPKLEEKDLIKGIFSEVVSKLKKQNACAHGQLFGQPHIVFDPEKLNEIMLEMLEQAEVKILFYSQVVASIMQGNSLKGVIVQSKLEETKIFALSIVDATGDGDVSFLSGADYEVGRKSDGLCQPATLMFRISAVDKNKMPSREKMNEIFSLGKQKNQIRTPRENFLWFETLKDDEIHVNSTRIQKIDGTSFSDLAKAEIEGRKQVFNLFTFLKENVPGFENSYISRIAPLVGIRESRRIIGEYILTEEDVEDGKKFDDPIAKNNYPIDIHSTNSSSTIFKKLGPGVYYEIPYRCLVPKKIDNLLVAGRAISTTHEALSSTRIMPVCMAIGQAAGIAASICAKKKILPRKLDYSLLRKELLEQNAEIR